MLGERLQELRKDHGLSQQDLADKLNVSIHTISSYERNRSAPDDTMKMEIAKLFDISLDYLLGWWMNLIRSIGQKTVCFCPPNLRMQRKKSSANTSLSCDLSVRERSRKSNPEKRKRPRNATSASAAFCFPYFELPITFQFCFK